MLYLARVRKSTLILRQVYHFDCPFELSLIRDIRKFLQRLLTCSYLNATQVYWWHDKYRPRKPKYFNRVHTGYEWNKYNQTHYDHDNPPPKIVQGYKFNIFYPDLVDKSKAPTYTIDKDGDSSETCIIRFHAGPPYEDIVSNSRFIFMLYTAHLNFSISTWQYVKTPCGIH